MELKLKLNGAPRVFQIKPGELLLETLRRHGLHSVKSGCGEGDCGACAVLVNGRPRNACLIFAASVEGAEVTTAEGLGNPTHPHPLQQAFVDAGATQCGYCNPGSLMAAKALLDRNPDPSEDDVKEALDGNLCRCTGYVKRIEAVLLAAKRTRAAGTASSPAVRPARGSGKATR